MDNDASHFAHLHLMRLHQDKSQLIQDQIFLTQLMTQLSFFISSIQVRVDSHPGHYLHRSPYLLTTVYLRSLDDLYTSMLLMIDKALSHSRPSIRWQMFLLGKLTLLT